MNKCRAAFLFDALQLVCDNDAPTADPESDVPDDEKRPAWTAALDWLKTTVAAAMQRGGSF
ncbi:hypothetical protein FUT69_01050 [Xylella taiwanensis]|uniref:Uncharacterized protein n=1 Tax=Xylella taiwanensis TaxID=1444770 RepID=Z9JJW0_9GAMM|nr:hypothetical protein [Xylella taiwanensis]AXI83073.1 hypothetical protein AB672_03465 [Xylella taiwanensis]EWS78705.1 hypothetical protein AF72_03830 [Xylella taiwanensis]MCD8456103.1 hypothetical protein [Xylella taiwanensis]MCD8458508.1 hypothetical protein [Xylella taiwanensis]MCD8460643.1 hypothetical protein [Xylella taiwanensis]